MTATLERPSAPDAYVAVSPGPWQVIRDLVILKAMLLRGTYRRSNVEAFGLVLAFAAGAFGGGSLAFFTTVAGRHNPDWPSTSSVAGRPSSAPSSAPRAASIPERCHHFQYARRMWAWGRWPQEPLGLVAWRLA